MTMRDAHSRASLSTGAPLSAAFPRPLGQRLHGRGNEAAQVALRDSGACRIADPPLAGQVLLPPGEEPDTSSGTSTRAANGTVSRLNSEQRQVDITRRIRASRTWQEAFQVFVDCSHLFNGINVAALATRMAQTVSAQQQEEEGARRHPTNMQQAARAEAEAQDLRIALRELLDFAESELPNMGPRELSNTLCSLGRLHALSRRFVQLLVGRAPPDAFNAQELAMTLCALARSGHVPADQRWLQASWRQVWVRRRHLKHQELTNCMWALARMQCHPGPKVLQALVEELGTRLPGLRPLDLTHAIWALSVLRFQPPAAAAPPAPPLPGAHTAAPLSTKATATDAAPAVAALSSHPSAAARGADCPAAPLELSPAGASAAPGPGSLVAGGTQTQARTGCCEASPPGTPDESTAEWALTGLLAAAASGQQQHHHHQQVGWPSVGGPGDSGGTWRGLPGGTVRPCLSPRNASVVLWAVAAAPPCWRQLAPEGWVRRMCQALAPPPLPPLPMPVPPPAPCRPSPAEGPLQCTALHSAPPAPLPPPLPCLKDGQLPPSALTLPRQPAPHAPDHHHAPAALGPAGVSAAQTRARSGSSESGIPEPGDPAGEGEPSGLAAAGDAVGHAPGSAPPTAEGPVGDLGMRCAVPVAAAAAEAVAAIQGQQAGGVRLSSHDAALALQALAKMQCHPGRQLMDALLQVVLACAWEAPPQDMACAVWAVARLGHTPSQPQLSVVLSSSTLRLNAYSAPETACLVGALARLGASPPPTWLRALRTHLVQRMDAYSPREVAHVMWGLARMHQRLSPRVITLLLGHMLPAGGEAPAAVVWAPGPHAAPLATNACTHAQGLTLPWSPVATHAATQQRQHTLPSQQRGQQQGKQLGQELIRGQRAGRLQHQHLANALGAVPWLLPGRQRYLFGHLQRALLQRAEQATLDLLAPPPLPPHAPTRDVPPPRHAPPGGVNDGQERGPAMAGLPLDLEQPQHRHQLEQVEQRAVPRPVADPAQRRTPEAVATSHEGAARQASPGPTTAASVGIGGWEACELLQVLQSFAALNHRPSHVWLNAHQVQAAWHWPRLAPAQQRRLALCYAATGGAAAVLRLQQRLPEPALAVPLCQALLHEHDLACPLADVAEAAGSNTAGVHSAAVDKEEEEEEGEEEWAGAAARLLSLQSACCQVLRASSGNSIVPLFLSRGKAGPRKAISRSGGVQAAQAWRSSGSREAGG